MEVHIQTFSFRQLSTYWNSVLTNKHCNHLWHFGAELHSCIKNYLKLKRQSSCLVFLVEASNIVQIAMKDVKARTKKKSKNNPRRTALFKKILSGKKFFTWKSVDNNRFFWILASLHGKFFSNCSIIHEWCGNLLSEQRLSMRLRRCAQVNKDVPIQQNSLMHDQSSEW